MTLGFIGTDYRYTPLTELEKIYFTQETLLKVKEQVTRGATCESDITEWAVLATCNRIEMYFVSENPREAALRILGVLAEQKNVPLAKVQSHLEIKIEDDVTTHLFRVVSGIESMVFGENEILAQVKDAQSMAQKNQTMGALLNKVFQIAITTGKRVRKETQISRGSYSLSSIAIECLRQRFEDFLDTRILLVGAGTMSLRALKKLNALKHHQIAMTNRDIEKLDRLKEKYSVTILPLDKISQITEKFDAIIVATSAPTYLLDQTHFTQTKSKQVIIDLSMPRNVDPEIAKNKYIELISIEGLEEVANASIRLRQSEMSKIQAIIDDEVDQLLKWVSFREELTQKA